MQLILDRIAGWEAAGLIDPNTALRLRSDEQERAEPEVPASVDESMSRNAAADHRPSPRSSGRGSRSSRCSPTSAGRSFSARSTCSLTRVGRIRCRWRRRPCHRVRARRGRPDRDRPVHGAAGMRASAVQQGCCSRLPWATSQRPASHSPQRSAWTSRSPACIVAAWAAVVAVGLRLYLPALTTQFTLLASLTGLAPRR